MYDCALVLSLRYGGSSIEKLRELREGEAGVCHADDRVRCFQGQVFGYDQHRDFRRCQLVYLSRLAQDNDGVGSSPFKSD